MLDAIAAERFAYVLAPRASGKSSLMGRAIRRLRADGQLAAVVDLAQIATRDDSADSARWHYSIAYRICRELRLRVDLQDWWQERKLLSSEQRLVEFFWDVVLTHTEGPVTVFFDEAERVAESPFAGELFAALNSVYMRRVSEPEYLRLNFAVFGVATPEQLCPDTSVSPFVTGRAVALDDFSLEECYALAPGFAHAEPVSRQVIARIHAWTHGQPYLTQKVARAIARKGGRPQDLDTVLHELFLGPRIRLEEAYLSHMRSLLTDGSIRSRQAVAMLRRLNKGQELIDDPGSPAQQLLRLGGFISSDENGMLRFRNRIVEQAFDRSWTETVDSRTLPRPLGAAAVAAALLVVGFWYLRVLPQPYIDTLALVSSDYALAEQAHRRLSALPGFGRRADRMLTAVMVRRSEEAESVDEVRAADRVLRSLPNRESLADRLLANFRLRQAGDAAQAGERDRALVHAIAAAEAGSAAARDLAASLIDGDYALLERSFHFDVPVADFTVDWVRGRVIAVDELNRLHRLPLDTDIDAEGSAISPRPASIEMTALEHVGVTRDLFVDEPGRAGDLQLSLTVEHPRSGDLLVRLRAPSGVAAEFSLPSREGGAERFVFTASTAPGLARLQQESMTGQWELTVFDRLDGQSGRLLDWSLRFPGVPHFWDDETNDGMALPDPVRTSQVRVVLGPDGRKAVAIPIRADARGAASVWDIGTGSITTQLPLEDRSSEVFFLSDQRVLVVSPMRARLWDVAGSEAVAEIVAENPLRVAVAPGGPVFGLAESIADRARVSLHRNSDGERVRRFETDAFSDWALATDGSVMAAVDGSRRGRLIDASTGELRLEFFNEIELEHVRLTQDHVVAIDRQGGVFAWRVATERRTLTPGDSVYLGETANADSIDVAGDGLSLTFIDTAGIVTVRHLEDGQRLAAFGQGLTDPVGVRFDPNGQWLASGSGSTLRIWRVPEAISRPPRFGDISAVRLAADGESAIIGFRDGQVRWLEELSAATADGPATENEYFAHRGVVTSLALDPARNRAASGGTDGVARVWDLESGLPHRFLLRHAAGPINALAFSPDGRWVVSGGPGSARVFDVETGSMVHEMAVDGDVLALDFAPDGLTLAVGDSAGNIHLESPDGTQGRLTIRGRSAITALSFTDTPAVLASGTVDGSLVFWDTLEASVVEGAYRFGEPVSWIAADGAGALTIRSGSWLYRLDRSSGVVTASGLLAADLRSDSSLAVLGPGRFRVLANAGGGRLEVADTRLAASGTVETANPGSRAGPPVPDSIDDLIARRDWLVVLGLGLDPASGSVRRLGP